MADLYPDPATVLAGVQYGPNDNDFTGSLELPLSPLVRRSVTGSTSSTVSFSSPGNSSDEYRFVGGWIKATQGDVADWVVWHKVTGITSLTGDTVTFSVTPDFGASPPSVCYLLVGPNPTVDAIGETVASIASGVAALPSAIDNATELLDHQPFTANVSQVRDAVIDELINGKIQIDLDHASVDGLANAMRAILAVLTGKASGLDTGSPAFRNYADTKNTVSATTDADGNRSARTIDTTD